MNLSFYTASAGAYQQQQRLDIHANNIANANTNGFRARVPAFSSLITGEVRGIEQDLNRGVGARIEQSELNMSNSLLRNTGRILDFAISGDGFFALRDGTTGEVYYTRDGSFVLSHYDDGTPIDPELEAQGYSRWFVSDGMGCFVVGWDGQPMDVLITANTDLSELDFNVGIFDWANRNGMRSLSDNRFSPLEKNGQLRRGTGKLIQGYLEVSNTDLGEEIARVIESQRSYSFLLRMMTSSDEIETTTNGLR